MQGQLIRPHPPILPRLMKDWTLARTEWESFLYWLNPEPDLAALAYEQIRHALILYFEKRQCADSAALADQTIDRVIRLLPSVIGNFSGPPLRYCYGVANYIFKEYTRIQVRKDGGPVTEARFDPYQPAMVEEQEIIDGCLSNCLGKLDTRKREVFLRYYLAEAQTRSDFRQKLAVHFGLTINALRLQMLRIKEELRICITTCQQQQVSR